MVLLICLCPISQRFTLYYNTLTTSAPNYPASVPPASTTPAFSTAPIPLVLPPPAGGMSMLTDSTFFFEGFPKLTLRRLTSSPFSARSGNI